MSIHDIAILLGIYIATIGAGALVGYEMKMTDMVKDNLCVKCALLKKVDKDGYITCPCFTNKQARAEGMNIFLHCFCTDCVRKEK